MFGLCSSGYSPKYWNWAFKSIWWGYCIPRENASMMFSYQCLDQKHSFAKSWDYMDLLGWCWCLLSLLTWLLILFPIWIIIYIFICNSGSFIVPNRGFICCMYGSKNAERNMCLLLFQSNTESSLPGISNIIFPLFIILKYKDGLRDISLQ